MQSPRPSGQLGPSLVKAYSATGEAWERAAAPIYRRLAEVLVAESPVSFDGRLVLDVGAGTGAASSAIAGAGGRPVAVDAAVGMLTVNRGSAVRVAGDALALPFADDSFGAAVAAFSFNHLEDAAGGFREAARATAGGGIVLASTYASDDDHPAKHAVNSALVEAGFPLPDWYEQFKAHAAARLATEGDVANAAEAAGSIVSVRRAEIAFPELDAGALVDWRLAMAHAAPIVTRLVPERLAEIRGRALDLMGPDPPPLIRRVILVAARVR